MFLIKVKSDWETSEEEVEDGEQQNTHVPTSSQASSPHEVSPPLVSPPHTDSDETDSALPPRSVEMDIDFPLIDNNVLLTDNNNVSSNQGCSARKRPRVRMRGRGVARNTGIVRGKSIRCRGGSNRGGANGVEIAGGSREDSADGAAVGGGGSSDGATVGGGNGGGGSSDGGDSSSGDSDWNHDGGSDTGRRGDRGVADGRGGGVARGRARGVAGRRGRAVARGRGRGVARGRGRVAGGGRRRPGSDDDDNDGNDEVHWDNIARDYRQFGFMGEPGVKVQPDDITCPLEVLKTFLTDEIMNDIVTYTNEYAELLKLLDPVIERMNESRRSLFNLWTPLTFDELWVFVDIIIMMGIIEKPHYHMYWTKDHIFSTPIFSRVMRRDRFEQIRKMIHFVDPVNEDPADSLTKLSSFLDHMAEKFKNNYIPEKNIAVDEYLSLWKGRLHFRVYIPNKRERYGIKIYMCCESDTGYLYSFIVYTGADTKYTPPNVILPKEFDEYTNYTKVVLSLIDGLYKQGYSVTVDNLYTSPELLLALYANGTDGYGTLRKKKGLPKDFWLWKPVKGVGELPLIKFHDKKLMILRWSDAYKKKKVKIVSMMSTKHVGKLVDTDKIHFSTKQPIIKPDVIKDYYSTMGGVDTLSRVCIPYSIQRKGLKWYRKLAELFIEFCIYNSYIVWKKLNNSTSTQYRQNLVKVIIQYHLCRQRALQPGRGEPINLINNPLRLIERHFISRKNQCLGRKYSKCVRCMKNGLRKETIYECRRCDVALCVIP